MRKHDFDEYVDRTNTLSQKWDKYAEGILPLWVADTDFRSPQPVVEALADRVAHGVFGYTGDNGSFERSTRGWVKRRYGWDIDTSWVLCTPSVVTSIALIIRALTAPRENVVIQPPVYPPFAIVTKDNGRVPLCNPLLMRNGTWHIDFDDLEAKLASTQTTLLLLCNPHNPTGRCFTREELRRIGELCLKHGVHILSDEIHSDFIFSGRHIPFPSLSAELARISAVCLSPSKTFNMADLRVSSLIIPDEGLRGKVKREITASRLGRCSLSIQAYNTAYTECDYYADQVKEYLGKNLAYATRYIAEKIPSISACSPEATFLLWLDCRKLGLSQPDLMSFFLDKAKVALNSGTDFGLEGEGFLRMNTGCPRVTLTEALGRMERAVNAFIRCRP
jgi:cystathionine beta-lyase